MGALGEGEPEPSAELRSGVGPIHTTAEASEGNEGVEGRGRPEGSRHEMPKVRTQSRVALPSHLVRVNEAARHDRQARFTALLHHVDVLALERAFRRLKRRAAAGIDGETVASYEQSLQERLQDLCTRVHAGRFRPQPVRRVYIAKTDGGQRPLGVPALEDKIVQGAVAEVLSAIYEVDFLGFSYGFRPGRSPHQALAALHTALMTQCVNWVLDADIRKYLTRLTTSGCYGCSRTGSPTVESCGLFAAGSRPVFWKKVSGTRQSKEPHKGRALARCYPMSFCTTSSICGSSAGVNGMRAET